MEENLAYSSGTLILVLALATLGAAVAFGLYQRWRVGKAKKNHEHSSLSSDPRLQNESPAAVEARRRS